MDPNSYKSVEGMPAPSPMNMNELQPSQPAAEVAPVQNIEAGPAAMRQGVAQPPMAAPMQMVNAQHPPMAATTVPSGPAVPAASTPAIADDIDLIEKEWVLRAKQIVDKTRENPFIQSKELNKIKAEYIKKRYNKEIKLSEE